MKVAIRKPPPPLSGLIEMIWHCENPQPPSRRERVMPSGQMALIVNLVDDRLGACDGDGRRESMSGIAFYGALPSHKTLDTADHRCIMGVHFKPGDEVGFTPKLYCRVRRFRRVLAKIESSRRVEWAGLAADCGSYDQAHFIRDFRTFSGWNPSAFVAIRGERSNHIPLPDGSAG